VQYGAPSKNKAGYDVFNTVACLSDRSLTRENPKEWSTRSTDIREVIELRYEFIDNATDSLSSIPDHGE
jgi:hypothetical protein